MPGITNVTNVTMENLTSIANITDPAEFFINVNNIAYGGILYFALLWVLWIILFFAGQSKENQPLSNGIISGGLVTMVSLFIRAANVVKDGVYYGMISDPHMWIFPLLTIILATIAWKIKND